MNKRIKAKWLKALRSGKYKQGKGRLKSTKGKAVRYCCLGVLCDILDQKKWSTEPGAAMIDGRFPSFWCKNEYSLPDAVKKRLALSASKQETLIGLNDSGKRFSTIANYIEENL